MGWGGGGDGGGSTVARQPLVVALVSLSGAAGPISGQVEAKPESFSRQSREKRWCGGM